MSGPPSLKTGTLLRPYRVETVKLQRLVSPTTMLAFEGLPDPQSPAQRTLHQALTNRKVGSATVYSHLRDYAIRVAWGFQPPGLAEVQLHLAFVHEPDGPKIGVMLRNITSTKAQWTAATESALTEAGWHLLIIDASTTVQTPHDAVDAILSVVSHVMGITMGTAPLSSTVVPASPEPAASVSPSRRTAELAKQPVVKAKRRPLNLWAMALAVATAVVVASFAHFGDQGLVGYWRGGINLHSQVQDVTMTKEGHAALLLADGRKTFVPAHAVKHNPTLLHDLIVAWRQHKPLTLFTTSAQHLKYGRQVGVQEPAGRSQAVP